MGFLLLLVLFLSQKAAAKSRGVHKEDEGNYSVSCEVGGNKNPPPKHRRKQSQGRDR